MYCINLPKTHTSRPPAICLITATQVPEKQGFTTSEKNLMLLIWGVVCGLWLGKGHETGRFLAWKTTAEGVGISPLPLEPV